MRFLDLGTPPVFSVSYLPVAAKHLLAPVDTALVPALLTETHGADDVVLYEEFPQLCGIVRHSRKLKQTDLATAAHFTAILNQTCEIASRNNRTCHTRYRLDSRPVQLISHVELTHLTADY